MLRRSASTLSTYLQIGDVNTWWDVHGAGEPLVLLRPISISGTPSRSNGLIPQ